MFGFLFRTPQLRLAQVDAGDSIATLGKLDGVPAGTTADIQNCEVLVIAQLLFDEVALTKCAPGEGLIVVVMCVVLEKRDIPRICHVKPPCLSLARFRALV
ncbi:hypothetical protein DSECCO2_604970 [anaerobic digester metagenome]